ncbi:MAG: family 78 glycoside hydrolase catalytic domain [Sedimentisphaerales bacterium]
MCNNNPFQQMNAVWMWPHGRKEPNQYVQFRQEFLISERSTSARMLYISTDTGYAVWINGQFAYSGQFHDWPDHKTYDSLDISKLLRDGTNTICILTYYQGINSAQYVRSDPRLIFAICYGNAGIVSGEQTYFRTSSGYRAENLARITPQLHFAFEFDSRMEDNWIASDYIKTKDWCTITDDDILRNFPSELSSRAIERVVIKERVSARIVAQGIFKRNSGNTADSVAQVMYHDFLSTRLPHEVFEGDWSRYGYEPVIIRSVADRGDGIYLVVDLDAEQAGIFEIDIDVSEGAIIDIAYGEHLDDLRVRSSIGSRNFANRYIAKNGRQKFTHYFTRFGCRYIQLHISNFDTVCKLYYAGLCPVEYPFELRGNFESDCMLQNKIYNTAVRTLQLSVHEHYEDSPWREQALYANDARNQALSGYYCFGEYKVPAASLELLGHSLKPDGFLELCAPAQLPITIPSFSMAWVLAVKDFLLYSGDLECTQALYGVVHRMINSWLASLKDGLMPCPTGARYWHFYDWAMGLDGTVQNDCTVFEEIGGLRYDAPLNLFLCLAFESASVLAKYCGNSRDVKEFQLHAEALKSKIHDMFFDNISGFYSTYFGDDKRNNHYAQLTQSLAVLAGICPDGIADSIRTELVRKDSNLIQTTLSQSLYKFEAMLSDKNKFGKYVFEKIENDWGHMLFERATSFWETLKGGWDFDLAGSLCHGWSAIPVYFYHAYLLGIRPVEPGFKKIIIDPLVHISPCQGKIPTLYGNIDVKINKNGGKTYCNIEYPKQIIAVIPNTDRHSNVIIKTVTI